MKRAYAGIVVWLALFAACAAMPVVPASQAPPPPSGVGWHCFQFRDESQTRLESRCRRTLAECIAALDSFRTHARDSRARGSSACTAAPKAWCMYEWREVADQGGTKCYLNAEECKAQEVKVAGAAGEKNSECTAYE